MRKKLSASLLAFMLVFQVLSSGYMAPFTALATDSTIAADHTATEEATVAEPTEEEIAAAKLALEHAEAAVNELFTDATHQTIKDGLVEANVNTAEAKVNLLTDGEDKTALQAIITIARTQIATVAEQEQAAKAEQEQVAKAEQEQAAKAENKTEAKETEEKATEKPATTKKSVAKKAMTIASDEQTKDLGNILTDVKLFEVKDKDQKSEVKLTQIDLEQPVYVEYAFEIPRGTYDTNTSYTSSFDLPKQFAGKKASGVIKTENKDDNIVYSISEGKVSITAKLSEKTVEELKNKGMTGTFYGVFNFDKNIIGNTSTEEVLVFTSGSLVKKFELSIKYEKAKNKVKKSGVKYENGVKKPNTNTPDSIVWTIDINNEGKEYSGSQEITENLPDGVTLVENTLTATSILVDRQGNFKDIDSQSTEKPTISSSGTSGKVEFTLSAITKPTRITFETTINDNKKQDSPNFKNTAEFAGIKSNEVTITTSYGSPLSKEAVSYDNLSNKAKWKITFNANNRQFDTAQTVSDVMKNTKNIEITAVKKDGIDVNTGATVTFADGKFTFPAGNSKWEVEYTTEYDRVTTMADLIVKNTANFNGLEKSAQQTIHQGVVKKDVKADFSKKTLEWTITLNASGGKLPAGTVITDTFDDKQKLVTDVKDIKVGNNLATLKTDNKGFEIKLLEELDGKVTIVYTTSFNPNDLPTSKKFTNNVTVKGTDVDISVTKELLIEAQTQNNGTKKGSYNKETHEITWTANINYNLNDISNAVFTDTWSGKQYFVSGSLTVKKLNIEADQDSSNLGADIAGAKFAINHQENGFTFNFKGLSEEEKHSAYQIQYKTKVTPLDDSITSTETTHLLDSKYNNVITYTSGGTNHTITSNDVSIENAGQYFGKSGIQAGETAKWTVNINQSGSYLKGTNTITDVLGQDQRLNPDSLKLYSVYDTNKVNIINKEANGNTEIIDNKIVITLGNLSTPYVLEYESVILADDGVEIKNEAKFENKNTTSINKEEKKEVKVDWARFGGSANISGSGKLMITKKGPDGKPLSNTEFEIYSSTDHTKLIEKVITNNEGVAQTAAVYKYKDYFVKEVKAAPGYKISKELKDGKTVTIAAAGVEFTNEVDLAACTQFTIKVDPTVGNVKRASITQDNKVVKSNFDSTSQTIKVTDLTEFDKTKSYTIELLTTENKKITVSSENLKYSSETTEPGTVVNCEATITAETTKGSVDACNTTTISVKDSDNQSVNKGKVVVYKKENNEKVDSQPIAEGKVVFNKYYYEKDYTIKVEIPTHQVQEVDLDGDCEGTVQIALSKYCQEITVTVKKATTDIENARVQIFDKNGAAMPLDADKKTVLVTDSKGQVTIPTEYATGDYKISVVVAGYQYTTEEFSPINCELTIDIEKNSCSALTFTFVNANNTPLTAGKVYVVNAANEKQEIGQNNETTVTLTNGEVTIPTKYATGDFKIVLVQQGKENFTTVINDTDCKQTIVVSEETEEKGCAATSIIVKDNGKEVENATIVIAEAGKEVFKGNTDENGKVTTEKYIHLANKDVTVSIHKVGYNTTNITNWNDENCEVIIDLTSNSCPDYSITAVYDEKLLTSDQLTQFIKDAAFTLTSADGKVALQNVKINNVNKLVDANGKEINKELLEGAVDEYTLTQTTTVVGFETIKPTKIVDLNNCSGTVTFNFAKTTDPTTPGISCPDFSIIYKGPAKSQAEFKLVVIETDATGKKVETSVTEEVKVKTIQVTNADGTTTDKQILDIATSTKPFTALAAGEYKVVQTKAHPGYDPTSKAFTVVAGECVAELTVNNVVTPPPVCDQDTVITVKDADGKEVTVSETTKVTVDGKEVPVTIENGKVVIPKEAIEFGKDVEVTVTLEDGRKTTETLSKDRIECTVEVVVPVLKVCEENPTVSITTTDGKKVPTELVEKVTVNGKEVPVKVENGKVVLPKEEVNPKEETTVIIVLKDGKEGTVTIPKYSEECNFTVIIDNACDSLTIYVTKNDKKATTGTVQIIDKAGNIVATKKVDSSGKVLFEAKYANSDYAAKVIIGSSEVTTTITVNQNCAMTINIVGNACEKAVVNVMYDDQPFKGAEVKVVNEDGKTVQNTTTDKNGQAIIKPDFANKDHKVKVTVYEETKTFAISHCEINIKFAPKPVVEGDTEEPNNPTTSTPTTPNTNTAGDDEKNGNTTGTKDGVKVPSSEKPGHKYDLYDENGNLIEKNVQVGNDGKVDVSKLPQGKYSLVSQDGGKTINFEVNQDGKLPQTGTQAVWMYTIFGLALLAVGAVMIGRNRKKAC